MTPDPRLRRLGQLAALVRQVREAEAGATRARCAALAAALADPGLVAAPPGADAAVAAQHARWATVERCRLMAAQGAAQAKAAAAAGVARRSIAVDGTVARLADRAAALAAMRARRG